MANAVPALLPALSEIEVMDRDETESGSHVCETPSGI